MIELNIRLTAKSGRAHDLLNALHARMRQSRRDAGCSGAHLAADVVEADNFWYCEDWSDAKALANELRTDRFSQLLALVETSAQPPIIEFRWISETRGLDYVAATRETAGTSQR